MSTDLKTLGLDGRDEIFFSESFNIYENELTLEELVGFKFKFIFETTDPLVDQNDVAVKPGTDKEIVVVFSKKFRNPLGSSTAKKLSILKTGDGREILLSVFGQQVGMGECLHITVNFYIR